MNLSGSWKGNYSYGDDDSFKEEFKLTLSDDDGAIQGVGYDLLAEELKFYLSGFFENGVLSLVKRYDGLYFHDDQGNTYLEEDMPSQEIQYTGTYDLEESAFIGKWEILIDENQVGLQEQYDAEYIYGEFKLFKDL